MRVRELSLPAVDEEHAPLSSIGSSARARPAKTRRNPAVEARDVAAGCASSFLRTKEKRRIVAVKQLDA
jgi:hypothetical protein